MGGFKAERVNGVGASLENGIVGLLVSFDVVNTGFGSVAGGCEDFFGVGLFFWEVGLGFKLS